MAFSFYPNPPSSIFVFLFQIRVASIAPRDSSEPDVFEGASFTMTGGDYSSLLELVNAELEQAKV